MQESDEAPQDAARRLALRLDRTVLPIQGPPGAGKTYTAAQMISDLLAAGKRVGITAVSHKVIRHLIDRSRETALAAGQEIACLQAVREATNAPFREETSTKAACAAIAGGEVQLAGGTAWMWAREEMHQAVDVLFVDEAAQMCLANVIAVSHAADSVVLLGDPQQLEQPQQGSHPDGSELSALDHVLEGAPAIAADRGLFLDQTWRLHPSICGFTSEMFYDGRLESRPELAQQALAGPTPYAGAGLWYVPVRHEGNTSASTEEVDAVERIVSQLLRPGVQWIDAEGAASPLTPEHILIVAPYNAQVSELGERLLGHRIGTVDRFQGQEAPVVIYSLTTSSPLEAPHGMEFLYSLNRLNVATSRARCACFVVGAPALFEPECRTPRQIRLANALCRYRELASRG